MNWYRNLSRKGKIALWVGIAVLVVLFIGALGSSEVDEGTVEAAPSTTVEEATTTTEKVTTTTARPTTTTVAPHFPNPEDFQIEIIETRRKCFGSAGCNIDYQIEVTYVGPHPMVSKNLTVIYEVHGADDVQIDSFDLAPGGQISYREGSVSGGHGPLTATPTRILGG